MEKWEGDMRITFIASLTREKGLIKINYTMLRLNILYKLVQGETVTPQHWNKVRDERSTRESCSIFSDTSFLGRNAR